MKRQPTTHTPQRSLPPGCGANASGCYPRLQPQHARNHNSHPQPGLVLLEQCYQLLILVIRRRLCLELGDPGLKLLAALTRVAVTTDFALRRDVLELALVTPRAFPSLRERATLSCAARLRYASLQVPNLGFQYRDLRLRRPLRVEPGLPAWLKGDPTRLRQVMVNLVGNAVKFTEVGSVAVSVKHRRRQEGGVWVEFSVQDTGIGISPDALERLFDAFTQADASTTRRYGGTGLGLAISRNLVELMGGELRADSKQGLGTRFWFELPFEPGEAPEASEGNENRPHTHRLNILVAEDYPTNQIIIRTLLEDRGHEIEIVENGRLAVEALSQKHYDLILMDGRMPEMDGATATRLIREGGIAPDAIVRQTDIPIIALTANATSEDRRMYLESGMDDFLSKPINEPELHEKLAGVIERLLAAGALLSPQGEGDAAGLDALFGVEDAAPPVVAPPPVASRPKPSMAEAPARPAAPAKPAGPKPDLRTRMLEAFRRDLPARTEALNKALAGRDAVSLAQQFHGIKGSAGFLEPDSPLHRLAGDLEKAADREDWPMVDERTSELLDLLEEMIGRTPNEDPAG